MQGLNHQQCHGTLVQREAGVNDCPKGLPCCTRFSVGGSLQQNELALRQLLVIGLQLQQILQYAHDQAVAWGPVPECCSL